MDAPITIIGGGVMGLSLAYELGKGAFLLEKSPGLFDDKQSTRSSGVIHAGIYYPKSEMPLKAEHCPKGNKLLREFCQEHNVLHRVQGKALIAAREIDRGYLNDVETTAKENGVPYKKVSKGELKSYEPNVTGLEAMIFPTSGVVEATSLIRKLYQLGQRRGAEYIKGHEVVDIKPKKGSFEVTMRSNTGYESFETGKVINCAGLYSDVIAKMVNPNSPYEIAPLRGESVKFYPEGDVSMNGMNVYPTPYGVYPNGEKADVNFEEFKRLFDNGEVIKTVGVHLTPIFDKTHKGYEFAKTITIGPAQVGSVGKEDYGHSRDKRYFLDRVKGFFPNLTLDKLMYNQTGIQAKVKGYKDWIAEPDENHPRMFNCIGFDSPLLTGCLSMARYISDHVKHS